MLINGAVGKGLCGMVPLSGGMHSRVSDCDRIMVYCRRESDESFASQITRTELPVTGSHGETTSPFTDLDKENAQAIIIEKKKSSKFHPILQYSFIRFWKRLTFKSVKSRGYPKPGRGKKSASVRVTKASDEDGQRPAIREPSSGGGG
ncbi:hypothetical protein TNIN_212941 [Trichonephila inaurata madagascariensis]|uniref:Uncharacterized protein n=1 Tax=Trichonephila inaurata madagascariensis TaxID=2747483 RepID=A0A8X6WUL0_9ARAC|nr:hypothetical protein TNIN_212941 [Trichonephila inaurata madagascariensis]